MYRELRGNTLYIDGCSAVALAREYATPLYVYSEREILRRIAQLRTCFLDVWPGSRAAYACKAFCTPALLKLIQREGLCIDVVSGGELYTALHSGFPPERIEFNGNNKLPAELELAVEHGIGRIILDTPQELGLLETLCRAKNRKMKVLYRITPGIQAATHDYITTGTKDSKFGLPLDEQVLYPAIQAATASPWIELLGLHVHLGSQLLETAPYLRAAEVLLNILLESRRRFGIEMTELNLGGGFGITYTQERRLPFSAYLTPVMERIRTFCAQASFPLPALVVEPGRSLVGEAGTTLYTIGEIKEIPGVRKYVSVDGGMTDNLRPALYQAIYRGILANRASEPAEETVTVCGKCCESGDILIQEARLPSPRRGDLLAVYSTGAYGYSMASNYNHNPIPAVVLVRDGESTCIVRRQSYAQMLENAVIPARLSGQPPPHP